MSRAVRSVFLCGGSEESLKTLCDELEMLDIAIAGKGSAEAAWGDQPEASEANLLIYLTEDASATEHRKESTKARSTYTRSRTTSACV